MTKYTLKDPKTCRIFLSSPFRGMEPERKEWMSKYVPQLDHLCRSHGVGLVVVDMRWGITEESTEQAQTVNICLREIDRTDIFIGIYAQRYGWHGEKDADLQRNINNASNLYPWIQSHRSASVTAIEYLHGHLNNPGALPACFAFRDKEYDEAQKKSFIKSKNTKEAAKYSTESTDAAKDLEKIKTKIISTKEKCLAVFDDYKTPAEGIAKVFEVVKKYIETELLAKQEQLSTRDHQLSEQDAFIQHHSATYVSDGKIVGILNTKLTGTNSPLLLTGQSGCGKSSLLCHWLCDLKTNRANKAAYIYHFVGCGDDSIAITSLLSRLYLELEYFMNPSKVHEVKSLQDHLAHKKETNDIKDLVRNFSAKMEELSAKRRIVLVIDGIENVEQASKTAKCLYWLPTLFPSNVTVIISCTSESTDIVEELKNVRQFDVLELQPLDKKHRREICIQTLKKHGKELKDSQVDNIISCQQTQVPIFLRTLLTELRMFGEFRFLDSKIDSLIKVKSAKELFQQLLIRLEEEFGGNKKQGNLVEQVLCCLCISYQGLSEQELMAVLDIPSHVWSPLYFAIEKFILVNGGLLQLGVSELEEAVADRYLKNSKTRSLYQRKLIQYFERLQKQYPDTLNVMDPSSKRPTDELPGLYQSANDKKGLVTTLTNLVTFGRLFLNKEFELLEYWKWVGYSGDKIVDLYIKAVDAKYTCLDKHRKNLTPSPEVAALSFLEAITYLMQVGHFQSALQTVLNKRLKYLDIKELGIGEDNRLKMICEVKQKLAVMFTNTGRFTEAEKLQTEVLQQRQTLVDNQVKGVKEDDLKNLGTSYHSLALLHTKLGNKEEAVENFKKALNIHEQCNNRLLVADSLHNIGVILIERHTFQQALQYCLQSLKIYEEEYFGHLPPAIGVMTGNIAVCYRNLGKLKEAENMYIRSREISEKALGYYHPNVAHAILNHGTMSLNTGDFETAERLFLESLEILQKCEERPHSPTSYKAREKLALSLLKQKKTDAALKIFDSLFKMMKAHKLIEDSFTPLYTLIVTELINIKDYNKAFDITVTVLQSSKKQDTDFQNFDIIRRNIKVDPKLLKLYSLEEGFKIWPGSFCLLKHVAVTDLIPNEDYQQLISKLDTVNSHVGLNDGLYETAMVWCQHAGKHDGVFKICEHAAEKYPNNTTFQTQLVQVLHEQGKYEEALPYAILLADKVPDKPEITLIAGEIAARTENLPLAKQYFQKVLDTWGDNTNIADQARSGLRVVNLLAKKL